MDLEKKYSRMGITTKGDMYKAKPMEKANILGKTEQYMKDSSLKVSGKVKE